MKFPALILLLVLLCNVNAAFTEKDQEKSETAIRFVNRRRSEHGVGAVRHNKYSICFE